MDVCTRAQLARDAPRAGHGQFASIRARGCDFGPPTLLSDPQAHADVRGGVESVPGARGALLYHPGSRGAARSAKQDRVMSAHARGGHT